VVVLAGLLKEGPKKKTGDIAPERKTKFGLILLFKRGCGFTAVWAGAEGGGGQGRDHGVWAIVHLFCYGRAVVVLLYGLGGSRKEDCSIGCWAVAQEENTGLW